MAKLSKKLQKELERILYDLKRGQKYLMEKDVVLANRRENNTRPLGNAFRDCPMDPGTTLTITDKQVGSHIAGLHQGIYGLEQLLGIDSVAEETAALLAAQKAAEKPKPQYDW